MVLLLQFIAFNIPPCRQSDSCRCDSLTIVDGDGTTLMEESCGGSAHGTVVIGGQRIGSILPPVIKSISNVVKVLFSSNNMDSDGWSLSWSAVTSGEDFFCRLNKDPYAKACQISYVNSNLMTPFQSLSSECSLATPGGPCTNLEATDCNYKAIGKHCCCGHCPDPGWLSLACVLDSTTGMRIWQPTDPLCPVGACGSEGEC